MIWYLLYPLRGTTEPPVLPTSRPLYSIFARYGRYAARHVVTTLLVSVAVATALIYPIPFLFTSDFINGASNLPRHVWTVAQPLSRDGAAQPDIIMRSMWVHASYMEALNTELLASALELQDELLGITKNFDPARARVTAPPDGLQDTSLSLSQRDAVHVANGLTDQSWFFHSPLLYWGCSRERILADQNILATVNDKKNQSTSANVTLRHSIVFSGKRFEDRRLQAADALVITLLHLRDSPVGRQWANRALELPQKVGRKWSMYPSDGRAASSQLYEFQFRPMSIQDIASFALAYGFTLVYFLISLVKLTAVKSETGLAVTIMAQIGFSIMSSFTVCAVFQIDLSRIPRYLYPLVVLAMSLEHSLRLIKAVMATPLEDSVSNRIGIAFGKTAPTALASTLQNVLLLAGLSCVVSPGVFDYCVFAAVAIVFDFFFLSTFFLSVLSVDVRRMELGDALDRAAMRHNRNGPDGRGRRSCLYQALQGKMTMSTRIAGTIVMFGFVLIAQWHFFIDEGLFTKLARLYRGPGRPSDGGQSKLSLFKDIHQARSPMSWLRMQDHDTAREVINIIKPSSYSYVARVYDPLVFVLKDSDRKPHSKEPTLLPAAYDFFNHELARFFVVIIVVIAALRLLTNFLLWEDEQSTHDAHDSDESPLLSVKDMARGHRMDVTLLAASADGHVVSVSLDYTIRVWSMREMGSSYVIAEGDEAAATVFPVMTMAMDDKSKWLALLTGPKRASPPRVCFWNLADRAWGPSVQADSCRQRPVAFFLDPGTPRREPRVLVVHREGMLSEISADMSRGSRAVDVGSERLTCARLVARKVKGSEATLQPVILTVSVLGDVVMASREDSRWRCQRVAIDGLGTSDVHNIEAVAPLDLFIVAAGDCVHLVSADDGCVLRTLQTAKMVARPLKCAFSCHGLSQPGSWGLRCFTLGYLEADSRCCILQTFMPAGDCEAIYLRTPCETRSSDWCTWDSARETRKRVADPGVWELVAEGSAVGIRHKQPVGTSSGLRNRYGRRRGPEPDPFEGWEVWTASAGGRSEADECQRLIEDGTQADHLLVTEVGPRARVGLNSAAFAFGDMIKVVMIGGQAWLEESAEDQSRESYMAYAGNRRRRPGTGGRARAGT